jgi:hypothetical protein
VTAVAVAPTEDKIKVKNGNISLLFGEDKLLARR